MTDRQGLPRQKSEGYSIVITEDEEASEASEVVEVIETSELVRC